MDRNFQYRGELSQTALPEVLFTIDRFQVPGVIEARQGEVLKRVFIKEGSVIHATSNDLEDSLGTFLFREGHLSEEVYRAIMRDRSKQSRRLGETLVEKGILAPIEVYEGIIRQLEAVVWSLFYWTEGQVSFSIGEFKDPDMLRIQLPMRQVILNGIKRAPNAKALVGRLGRKETIYSPSYTLEDVIELALDEADYKLLRLVDNKRSLYEICSGGPMSPAENAKLMYAFRVLQLVREQVETDQPAGKEGKPVKVQLKGGGERFAE